MKFKKCFLLITVTIMLHAKVFGCLISCYEQNIHAVSFLSDSASEYYTAIEKKAGTLKGSLIDRIDGQFYDTALGNYIKGYMLIISGSRTDLKESQFPTDIFYEFLKNEGWSENINYAADGPDGTVFAFIKNNIICIVKGHWDGGIDSDSAYVPPDLFQVTIICGEYK